MKPPSPLRSQRLALPALLLLAALPRLWGLDRLPPGLQFDEAHNALDALRVLGGARDAFFVDNGGREPLSIYLQALALAILGEDRPQQALRLVSALAGLGGIAAAYGWARSFLGRRLPALATAGFLAASYWHLHFSRYGIRAILAPLCVTLALWAWWRALRPGDPPAGGAARRPWSRPAAIACGVAMAAAVYAHPTGRLLPLVLLGHLAWLAWRDRARLRPGLRAFLLAGTVAFLLFLPLGLFFLRHPVWFVSHPGDVSLAAVAEAQFGGSLGRTLLHQLWAVAGMFFVSGDPSAFHNLPCLPVWDPLSALLGVLGLGLLAGALLVSGRGSGEVLGDNTHRGGGVGSVSADEAGRERAVFLFLWLAVFLLPTLLSDRAPNYSRAIAALPVIALLPALGAELLVEGLRPRRPRLAAALLPLTLGLAGTWTFWQYGVVFGGRTPLVCGTDRRLDLYRSYDLDKRDAYDQLAAEAAAGAAVFLHPLWAGHASFAYLNRHGPVRSLDPQETLVLPAGEGPLIVAAPAKEAEKEGWFRGFEAAGQLPTTLHDPAGRPLLSLLRLDARERFAGADGAQTPDTPTHWGSFPLRPDRRLDLRFADGLLLEGLSWEAPRPGEVLRLHLFWRAVAPLPRDWTAFAQVLGPEGQAWGQADRQPGGGSFPTRAWRAGDRVIQRLEPVLDAQARGALRLRLGWYDPLIGERLPLALPAEGAGLPAGEGAVDGGTALLLQLGATGGAAP